MTGPLADQVRAIDQRIAALRWQRAEVVEWLRASAKPVAAPQAPTQVEPPPEPLERSPADAPPGTAAAAGGSLTRAAGQQLLLGVGVVVLLVAAAVFLAVAWRLLGVTGQVSVMAVVTAAAALTARAVFRRGLTATGEAVAVLAVGLAAVDVAAARTLGLGDLETLEPMRYAAVGAAGVGVLAAVASVGRSRLRAFPAAAVAAAAVAGVLTVGTVDVGSAGTSLLLLVLAGAFTIAGWVLRRVRWLAAVLAAGAGSAFAVLATLTGLGAMVSGSLAQAAGGAAAALTAATAFAAAARWFHRDSSPVAMAAAVTSAALAGLTALTGLAEVVAGSGAQATAGSLAASAVAIALAIAWWRAYGPTPRLLGVVAAALAAGVVVGDVARAGVGQVVAVTVLAAAVAAPLGLRLWPGRTATSGAAGLAAATVFWGALATLDNGGPVQMAVALMAVAVTLAARSVRAARPGPEQSAPGRRAVVSGGTGLAIVAAVASATAESSTVTTVAALTMAALAMWGLAALCRGATEELSVAVIGAVATALAVWTALDVETFPPLAAVVLATTGLTAFAYALLPSRGVVALAGIGFTSASTWLTLADAHVGVVEAYTLPLAVLLLVLGAVRLRRDPAAPSWATMGPACSVALMPSAAVAAAETTFTRPAVVLVAGAVVLLTGVARRWQAPTLTGAAAVLVVTMGQLEPYAVGLPRWLTLGAIGAALIAVGARYEHRRANVQHAARWIGALR